MSPGDHRSLSMITETTVTHSPPLRLPRAAAHTWFVADGILERFRKAVRPRTEARRQESCIGKAEGGIGKPLRRVMGVGAVPAQ